MTDAPHPAAPARPRPDVFWTARLRTRAAVIAASIGVLSLVLTPDVGAATTAWAPHALAAPARTVTVPASIDATGAADTSDALIAFIASTPDGTTIKFRSGVYRLDHAIKFHHRANLTLTGTGTTLKAGGGTTEASALFWLGSYGAGNANIKINGFNLVGNSTSPGVFRASSEGAHGILIDGGHDIEVSGVTIRGVWGDCFYLGSWTQRVWIHDASCTSSGRSGLTITSAQDAVVERVAFGKIGYCAFNIEPNTASEGARRIRIRNNTVATWGNSFFSAVGAPGSVVSGVSLTTNVVTGASLLTVVDLASGRQNIALVNNVSRVRTAGPVLRFAHINGLDVRGNVQPLSGGSLLAIASSTRVTTN